MSLFFSVFSAVFSFAKKIVLVVVVLVSVTSVYLYLMKTDRPKLDLSHQDDDIKMLYAKVNDPELKKTESGRAAITLYRNIVCSLIGEICTDNPREAYAHHPESLMGRMTGLISTPYANPPASGAAWAYNTAQNAGFVPKAEASEGIGFASIKGYMRVWVACRDIAFLLLVLFTLIIGFMIMFRVKLDAQTVISIENALPRIVITMIYISFSFAIVGLLIDAMYLLIGISVDVMLGYALGFSKAEVFSYQNSYMAGGFFNLWPTPLTDFGSSTFGVGSAFWNMIPLGIRTIFDAFVVRTVTPFVMKAQLYKWENLFNALNGVGVATVNTGNIWDLTRLIPVVIVESIITSYLPGVIMGLIIGITLVFFMFKIFFIVLNSYIKIILYVIFAPIVLLFNTIPGNNTFGWWIRNVIGELIVFPTIVFIVLAGNAIMVINSNLRGWGNLQSAASPLPGGATYLNPSSSTFLLPFLYGFRPEDFTVIIGLGVVLLTPDFIKMVRGWVGATDSGLNLSLGTFFAGGTAMAGGALGLAGQWASLEHTLVGLTPDRGLLNKFEGNSVVASIIKSLGGKLHTKDS